MTGRAVTTRSIQTASGELTYTAHVVETVVSDGSGEPGATYVCTEYMRADVPDADRTRRPVLFVFNGGPGSSSVWTHLGVGPRRVAEADTLEPRMSAPFDLVDNAETLLDVADLVFVDPPGTGYSRLLDPAKAEAFFGIEQDARATLELIARWTRRHAREASPRFVVGESYGTLRAARMVKLSAGGPFMGGRTRATSLAGAIVLGPAMSMGLAAWTGPVAAAMALATLVPTANHHHGLVGDRDAAWEFARTQLLPALVAGELLGADERSGIEARVAELTGLPVAVVRERGPAVGPAEYARLVLAGSGRHVGLYDSRYTLSATGAGADPVADDPGMGQYAPMFLGAIEAYLRDELGYASDDEYIGIDFAGINARWDYGAGPGAGPGGADPQGRPVSAMGDFVTALRRDPRFEVLIGIGDYDLVTTWAETRFALAHTPHDTSRVHLKRYPSGHMPYLGSESRAMLHADLAAFVGRLAG